MPNDNSTVVDRLMDWEPSGNLANATKRVHARNHAVASPLATLAGYVYAQDVEYLKEVSIKVFSRNNARSSAEKAISVKRFQVSVDGMLIESTADLVRIRTATGGHLGVLCYRGTLPENIISILGLLELDAAQFAAKDSRNPVPTEWDGAVHSGFYRNFLATRDEVVEALQADVLGELRTDGQEGDFGKLERLYLSGHSLGGAMALLMAVTLATAHRNEIGDKLKGVYTFGQPMVGDTKFADYCKSELDKRLIRYINRKDLVPHLPPSLSTGDFAHVGDEYRYDDQQERGWKYSPELASRGDWKVVLTAADYLRRRVELISRTLGFLRVDLPFSIDDHYPTRYIDTFENVL